MSPARALAWGAAWWLETPSSARRPAVVLSRPEALGRLPWVLVALATTHVRGLPTEVHLDEDDGMPRECVLNLDMPELVSVGLLVDYIATLSEVRMQGVCRALAAATNCTRGW